MSGMPKSPRTPRSARASGQASPLPVAQSEWALSVGAALKEAGATPAASVCVSAAQLRAMRAVPGSFVQISGLGFAKSSPTRGFSPAAVAPSDVCVAQVWAHKSAADGTVRPGAAVAGLLAKCRARQAVLAPFRAADCHVDKLAASSPVFALQVVSTTGATLQCRTVHAMLGTPASLHVYVSSAMSLPAGPGQQWSVAAWRRSSSSPWETGADGQPALLCISGRTQLTCTNTDPDEAPAAVPWEVWPFGCYPLRMPAAATAAEPGSSHAECMAKLAQAVRSAHSWRCSAAAPSGQEECSAVLVAGPSGCAKLFTIAGALASLSGTVQAAVLDCSAMLCQPSAEELAALRKALVAWACAAPSGGDQAPRLCIVHRADALATAPSVAWVLSMLEALEAAARLMGGSPVGPAVLLTAQSSASLSTGVSSEMCRHVARTVELQALDASARSALVQDMAGLVPPASSGMPSMAGFSAYDCAAAVQLAHMAAGAAGQDVASPFACRLSHATARVPPSALRATTTDIPKMVLADVAGARTAKAALVEAAVWPLTRPELYSSLGVTPPRGVLLFGPPGCGKTMLARALAGSGTAHFLPVKAPEVFSAYVGDSEKAVADIFRRARAAHPCVVFLDEIDAIGTSRSSSASDAVSVHTRVLNQLLVELDGVGSTGGGARVVVVAATNRPDLLDPALLRPGRLERHVYVGPPDEDARAELIGSCARRHGLTAAAPGVEAGLLAATAGLTGAELVGAFRAAAMAAMREQPASPHLTWAHVQAAAADMPKSVTQQVRRFYQRWGGV